MSPQGNVHVLFQYPSILLSLCKMQSPLVNERDRMGEKRSQELMHVIEARDTSIRDMTGYCIRSSSSMEEQKCHAGSAFIIMYSGTRRPD
jgi:hypothetical protein